MQEPLLTIDEVAWYLRLSHMTIYRMIQRGELQAVKVANQWRFRRETVGKWLSDRTPSEEISPPGSIRGESMDFEKRYRPAIHQFIREIAETNPDIIALVDRRGARLFSQWEQPPPEYSGLVLGYQALECMPDSDIKGKCIALLDDSIQHGTTLNRMRKNLELRGGLVRTYAFLGCESFLRGEKELMEPEVRVCLRFPDSEFTKVLAEATEYLLRQGKTQDTDHFVLLLNIRGKKAPPTAQQFLDFLASQGEIFTVPSPAEENGILTVTLDRPSFFRFETQGIPVDIDFSDGVVKTRFYYNMDTNTCLCLPIVMAKVRLNTDTYFDTERDNTRLPINMRQLGIPYEQLSDNAKATFCYRDITTNISIALAEQTIRQLNSKSSPFLVSLGDPPTNREDLEQCYGKLLGGGLAERIVQHLSRSSHDKVGLSRQGVLFKRQIGTELSPVSAQSVGQRQLRSLLRIMPAIDLLTKWYDDLKESVSDREQRLLDNGITFQEMCNRLEGQMDSWEVSFALDFGLDRTVIAPVHLVESLGTGEWEIRKAYRPGESSPGTPPKVGHGDSKALDPALLRFRRDKFLLPFLVDRLMEYCPSQKNGVEPLLLFKVLACLRLDWLTKDTRKLWTFWESPPAEFGPLPEIPHSVYFIEDGGNPYQLAKSCQAYINYGPIPNPKTGKISKKSYFTPSQGWQEVVQQYYDGDDLSAIDAYLQFYSALYNGLDATSSRRPSVDVLLTLSACFSEGSTYRYAHRNLTLWVSRFGHFIDLCRQKLADAKEERIGQTIYSCERTAEVGIDKILRYEHLKATEETVRQTLRSHSNVLLTKRGTEILSRIEKSDYPSTRLLTMKQMAELMKAVSTLTKYLFSRIDYFNIPDTRSGGEQAHELNYYLASAKLKSKGLVKVSERFRAFEIPEDSINIKLMPHLLRAVDLLYQEICLSFSYNCPIPDLDLGQDSEVLLDNVNRAEKWLAKHATKIGVFMFTDLDKSTSQFAPLKPIQIGKVMQWYEGPMQSIIAQFRGEIQKTAGDGKFVVFEHEEDALVAAITILQNIAQVAPELNLLPICIGICKGEYLQTGTAARNELGAKINWASKLSGIDPPGLYITEDILKTVNELAIKTNERIVPDSFAALGQKIFSVQWNLVELKEVVR